MDLFKTKAATSKLAAPAPSITHAPSKQPAAGGARIKYRLMGVWQGDVVVVPSVMSLQMSEGRTAKLPGDEIELTRQEAAVVQKHYVLVPVI